VRITAQYNDMARVRSLLRDEAANRRISRRLLVAVRSAGRRHWLVALAPALGLLGVSLVLGRCEAAGMASISAGLFLALGLSVGTGARP
jgi:hypothetical protein